MECWSEWRQASVLSIPRLPISIISIRAKWSALHGVVLIVYDRNSIIVVINFKNREIATDDYYYQYLLWARIIKLWICLRLNKLLSLWSGLISNFNLCFISLGLLSLSCIARQRRELVGSVLILNAKNNLCFVTSCIVRNVAIRSIWHVRVWRWMESLRCCRRGHRDRRNLSCRFAILRISLFISFIEVGRGCPKNTGWGIWRISILICSMKFIWKGMLKGLVERTPRIFSNDLKGPMLRVRSILKLFWRTIRNLWGKLLKRW